MLLLGFWNLESFHSGDRQPPIQSSRRKLNCPRKRCHSTSRQRGIDGLHGGCAVRRCPAYDPSRPVVYMDESDKQLIGEVCEPRPTQPGQSKTIESE